jgi:hypothetical protein
MANNPITTVTNTAIVPQLWSANFYQNLRVKLPFIDSVSTEYQGEIKALGNQVNISTIAEFTDATELAQGAYADAEAVSTSNQALIINKMTHKDFSVTTEAELQSLPFVDTMRDAAMYSILKRMQAVIIGDIVPSAATPDHQISYDSATTLALADILEVKDLLDLQNVDEDLRVGVVGSSQANNLLNVTGFVSRDFIPAGSPLTSGKIETPVCGFMIKSTTAVGNTSYWFHPSFLTMAVQKELGIKVADLAVLGGRGYRVNTEVLWGLRQLSNIRIASLS